MKMDGSRKTLLIDISEGGRYLHGAGPLECAQTKAAQSAPTHPKAIIKYENRVYLSRCFR